MLPQLLRRCSGAQKALGSLIPRCWDGQSSLTLPGDTEAQQGAGASEPSAVGWGVSRAAALALERCFQQLIRGSGAGPGLLRPTLAQSMARLTSLGDRPTQWATLHPCSPLPCLIPSPRDSIQPISAKKPACLQTSHPRRYVLLLAYAQPQLPGVPLRLAHTCVDFRTVKHIEMLLLCKFLFEIVLTQSRF